MLDGAATRAEVQGAASEQDGLLGQFVALLLKEEERQAGNGKPNITITDTQCKP